MKKILISLAALVSLTLTGCKGDYDDWTQPQHNDVEATVDQLMSVKVDAPTTTIELEEAGDSVQIFKPVEIKSSVANSIYVTLTDSISGGSKKLQADAQGRVNTDSLSAAIESFFGKKQAERTMTAQVSMEYLDNGSMVKTFATPYIVKVLPKVPDMNYWIYGKQNNRDGATKTLPLMPVTKAEQTVTTYFSGAIDTKMKADDIFSTSQSYGATGGTKKTLTGEFSIGGGYICPPAAGWYKLTFNFVSYTYSFEKLENQEPTAYTSVSLSGAFNGWTDTDMTKVTTSNDAWDSHCWYMLDVTLPTGELKFRADHAWTTAWGGKTTIKDTTYAVGDTTGGSSNITVAAGTYDIYFNDITGEYLFIKK